MVPNLPHSNVNEWAKCTIQIAKCSAHTKMAGHDKKMAVLLAGQFASRTE